MAMHRQLALVLFVDVVYEGDLPVLAFARHCAESLPAPGATELIDGVRFFLEGKSVGASRQDLGAAGDGFEAVQILAAALAVPRSRIEQAYLQSRSDLAASAFALDPPAGLPDLLDGLPDVRVTIVTDTDRALLDPVLSAVGIARRVDQIRKTAAPEDMSSIVSDVLRQVGRPGRLLVVGTRWDRDLSFAAAGGAVTALVEKFPRPGGHPDLRSPDLLSLVPGIRSWADRNTADRNAGPAGPDATPGPAGPASTTKRDR